MKLPPFPRSPLVRILSAIVASGGLFVLLAAIVPLPPVKPYSLVVSDRNGQFLQAFRASDGMWRFQTPPDEIPQRFKKILIEKEDRWFYFHPGFNPVSIVRAAIQNIIHNHRVSGASTITMQVARMLEPKNRTYFNKLIQIFRAVQIELRYSKKEILEMYVSMVPLGSNIEGLKTASMIYYLSPLERLNVAQLLDLIVIPNDPNDLQPDRNPGRLYAARMREARKLAARGVITAEDMVVMINTSAAATRNPLPKCAQHFCLRLRNQYPSESIIRSSLDLRLQKKIETLLSNHLRPWKL